MDFAPGCRALGAAMLYSVRKYIEPLDCSPPQEPAQFRINRDLFVLVSERKTTPFPNPNPAETLRVRGYCKSSRSRIRLPESSLYPGLGCTLNWFTFQSMHGRLPSPSGTAYKSSRNAHFVRSLFAFLSEGGVPAS